MATNNTATAKMNKNDLLAMMAEQARKMDMMMEALQAAQAELARQSARATAAEAANAELASELAKTPAQRKADAKKKLEADVQREAFIDRAVTKALADFHGAVAHRFYSERKGNDSQRLGELDYECEEAAFVYERVLMESANPDREEARKAVAFVLPTIEGGNKKPKATRRKKADASTATTTASTVVLDLANSNISAFDIRPVNRGYMLYNADGKSVVKIKLYTDGRFGVVTRGNSKLIALAKDYVELAAMLTDCMRNDRAKYN